jgi:hypothetical protein
MQGLPVAHHEGSTNKRRLKVRSVTTSYSLSVASGGLIRIGAANVFLKATKMDFKQM